VDKAYRGKTVTHTKVRVNDELLYEFLDHDRIWTEGHFAFSTIPAARSRSARSR
jgi:hypothetical protein